MSTTAAAFKKGGWSVTYAGALSYSRDSWRTCAAIVWGGRAHGVEWWAGWRQEAALCSPAGGLHDSCCSVQNAPSLLYSVHLKHQQLLPKQLRQGGWARQRTWMSASASARTAASRFPRRSPCSSGGQCDAQFTLSNDLRAQLWQPGVDKQPAEAHQVGAERDGRLPPTHACVTIVQMFKSKCTQTARPEE